MVDAWWGITEPKPKEYNFAPYRRLIDEDGDGWGWGWDFFGEDGAGWNLEVFFCRIESYIML